MKNWKSILLCPEATIRDAMRTIDGGSLRIALVCDARGRLLGTVTDGDIRRALLSAGNMGDSVSEIMNTDPVWTDSSSTREHRLGLLKHHDLLAVPILDEHKRIISLETLYDAIQPERRDNPVFIMAGGFGTRLQPLTDHCPKPMLRVGDKPMLEHLICQFVSFGFHNFYISTHYLPHVISDYFGDGSKWSVSIHYVHEETPLGTAGALGLLPRNLPSLPLIMVNGDVLTTLNYNRLLRHHEQHAFDATVCVRELEYRVPFGVIESEGMLVCNMVEKPTYRYKINTGIYVLNQSVIDRVEEQQCIDMPMLLEQVRRSNKRIGTYSSFDYWLDIGQMKDYQQAQKDIEIYFSED